MKVFWMVGSLVGPLGYGKVALMVMRLVIQSVERMVDVLVVRKDKKMAVYLVEMREWRLETLLAPMMVGEKAEKMVETLDGTEAAK